MTREIPRLRNGLAIETGAFRLGNAFCRRDVPRFKSRKIFANRLIEFFARGKIGRIVYPTPFFQFFKRQLIIEPTGQMGLETASKFSSLTKQPRSLRR